MSLLYHSIGYHKGWNILFNERFKIFQIIDFEQVDEFYTEHWDENLAGYANVYLRRCNRESKSNDEIDKELYAELVKLDTRLGTLPSKQLFMCVFLTLDLKITKVCFQLKIKVL